MQLGIKTNNVMGVIVGSLNMDLVAVGESIPRPGETLPGSDFRTIPGGKGGNQAVACANLGIDVRMVGRVGQDGFGSDLKAALRSSKIDDSHVYIDNDVRTGVALISVDHRGENSILAVYGANFTGQSEQEKAAKEALDGADFVLLQNEIPHELNLFVANYAKSINVPVFWDPAPANANAFELMKLCSYITPNHLEAEALINTNIRSHEDAFIACNKIMDITDGEVMPFITLGSDGVVFISEGTPQLLPSFSVETIDTVAAGDAFVAGLAVGISEKEKSMSECCRFASAVAALSVTRRGAQDSMPMRFEVDEFLK